MAEVKHTKEVLPMEKDEVFRWTESKKDLLSLSAYLEDRVENDELTEIYFQNMIFKEDIDELDEEEINRLGLERVLHIQKTLYTSTLYCTEMEFFDYYGKVKNIIIKKIYDKSYYSTDYNTKMNIRGIKEDEISLIIEQLIDDFTYLYIKKPSILQLIQPFNFKIRGNILYCDVYEIDFKMLFNGGELGKYVLAQHLLDNLQEQGIIDKVENRGKKKFAHTGDFQDYYLTDLGIELYNLLLLD